MRGLALLAMRVFLAADDETVDSDQDGQDDGKRRLYDNQDNSSDRLGGLRDAELFDKDQYTYHRKHTHDLDDDIDPIAGLPVVWAAPEKEDQHESFDDELATSLNKAVAVGRSEYAAFSEHIDDGGHKEPPVALLVIAVKDLVLLPSLFVLI